MHPEVEQFIAAMEAAEAAENAACNAAWKAFDEAAEAAGFGWHSAEPYARCPRCEFSDGPGGTARDAAMKAAGEAAEAAENAAWDALKASGDPLVAWIAAHCRGYAYEATEVLRALPAPIETLDALARKRGWCGIWREFRERAEQDGVLPSQSEVPAA